MPARPPVDALRGSLDLLVLKTLSLSPMHGWGISQRVQQMSDGEFAMNQGPGDLSDHERRRGGWVLETARDAAVGAAMREVSDDRLGATTRGRVACRHTHSAAATPSAASAGSGGCLSLSRRATMNCTCSLVAAPRPVMAFLMAVGANS